MFYGENCTKCTGKKAIATVLVLGLVMYVLSMTVLSKVFIFYYVSDFDRSKSWA